MVIFNSELVVNSPKKQFQKASFQEAFFVQQVVKDVITVISSSTKKIKRC
jgi:hypothetical protein